MGNSCRVFIAVILIISLFTVSVFATPTGSYDLYSTNGRNVNSFTASGNTYISNFSQHLAYIRVYLDQILAYDANIVSTLDFYLPLYLRYIVDDFSPGAGDTRSMWTLMSQAVSGITAIQSAALGIAQDVYNINTTTADIDRLAGLIHSDVDQVESQLTTINNNLNTLTSKYSWNHHIFDFVFDGLSSDNLSFSTSNVSGKTLYAKCSFRSLYPTSPRIFHLKLPVGIYDLSKLNNIEIVFTEENIIKLIYYNVSFYYTDIYLYSDIGQNYINSFTVKYNFDSNQVLHYRNQISSFVDYMNYDNYGFYDFLDHLALMSLESNSESTLSDIKNILIDIDNNSDFIQNNNDLEINVDIDAADGVAITGVINKLKSLFSTGVGLSQFLLSLNEFDNLLWFTSLETYQQVNYNPNVSGNGYQDLYD